MNYESGNNSKEAVEGDITKLIG